MPPHSTIAVYICKTKGVLDQAVGGKDAFKDAAENTKKIDEKVTNAGEMFHAK